MLADSLIHVRQVKVTCTSFSSAAMVPYVCWNVYVVCFFQHDLCPSDSSEPHSPRRGSELHAIYKELAAGALLAKLWQEVVWVGANRGSFRLIQALEIALQRPESHWTRQTWQTLSAPNTHQRNGAGSCFQAKVHKYVSVLPPTMSVPDFSLARLARHGLGLRFTALLPAVQSKHFRTRSYEQEGHPFLWHCHHCWDWEHIKLIFNDRHEYVFRVQQWDQKACY